MMKLAAERMHAANSVTSSQDFHSDCVKSVVNLKIFKRFKFLARIFSKRQISGRNGKTRALLSKGEASIKNGIVGTYAIS